MIYKTACSLALVAIGILSWAVVAIVSNLWLADKPGIQFLAWLAIAIAALVLIGKGVARIWHGEALSDVLHSLLDE